MCMYRRYNAVCDTVSLSTGIEPNTACMHAKLCNGRICVMLVLVDWLYHVGSGRGATIVAQTPVHHIVGLYQGNFIDVGRALMEFYEEHLEFLFCPTNSVNTFVSTHSAWCMFCVCVCAALDGQDGIQTEWRSPGTADSPFPFARYSRFDQKPVVDRSCKKDTRCSVPPFKRSNSLHEMRGWVKSRNTSSPSNSWIRWINCWRTWLYKEISNWVALLRDTIIVKSSSISYLRSWEQDHRFSEWNHTRPAVIPNWQVVRSIQIHSFRSVTVHDSRIQGGNVL